MDTTTAWHALAAQEWVYYRAGRGNRLSIGTGQGRGREQGEAITDAKGVFPFSFFFIRRNIAMVDSWACCLFMCWMC